MTDAELGFIAIAFCLSVAFSLYFISSFSFQFHIILVGSFSCYSRSSECATLWLAVSVIPKVHSLFYVLFSLFYRFFGAYANGNCKIRKNQREEKHLKSNWMSSKRPFVIVFIALTTLTDSYFCHSVVVPLSIRCFSIYFNKKKRLSKQVNWFHEKSLEEKKWLRLSRLWLT